MHPIDLRLNALGITLPPRSKPAGNYLPAARCDRLLFISGQFPLENDRLKYVGQVGRDLTLEDGYHATRLAALNEGRTSDILPFTTDALTTLT